MGNRAVITNWVEGETQKQFEENVNPRIGIYVHWNGGRDSVEPFLIYCDMQGYRYPETDNYGWARLCQVIANFLGGNTSIGIDMVEHLDCDNWDNGVYLIKDWKIAGRYYYEGAEQNQYDRLEMLKQIDKSMPEKEQLGDEEIEKLFEEYNTPAF